MRLKATDIQPDIFSYLLNLMYTGKLAPQLIDPTRLEQGVRFLHAYPLLQEASQSVYAHPEQSINLSTSLYGIQIADQKAALSARLPLSSPIDMETLGSEAQYPSVASAAKPAASPPEAEASTSGVQPTEEEAASESPSVDAGASAHPPPLLPRGGWGQESGCVSRV